MPTDSNNNQFQETGTSTVSVNNPNTQRKAATEEIARAMTGGIIFKGSKLKTSAPNADKTKTKAKKKVISPVPTVRERPKRRRTSAQDVPTATRNSPAQAENVLKDIRRHSEHYRPEEHIFCEIALPAISLTSPPICFHRQKRPFGRFIIKKHNRNRALMS